ncbi:thermonuclease family protein [Magnetospirillum sulfuroxidans]|uniref:Thermonuclease family protein n=1 Tax=Magnetospirillum sulfuroxidans TaxID=611300 RepID=A0ABS5IDQ8_9PROT|nr:thermonuclease family protein [Magnetospirillum sulfuroxidans]MBR9972312.1 thermonuclease family protein [Magnetospirillum sulfuroxidans]
MRVIDGDTVLVRARIWLGQEVETRVRLLGIDTPEKRGKCDSERQAAEKAESFTVAKLTDDAITLHDVIADKFGKRVVARIVTAHGEDLGDLLLSNGLARAYGGRTKQPWCTETATP